MHQPIADLAANSSTSTQPSLPLWESLMRRAMHASSDHRSAAYEHALSIALQLIDAPPPGRDEDCIAALVVSHHNLADLHAELGDANSAARQLCRAHETLCALSLSATRPAPFRHIALRHSRETHVALIRHLARYGPNPRITRTLENASLALHADNTARH